MNTRITSSRCFNHQAATPSPQRRRSRLETIEPLEARIAPAVIVNFNGSGSVVVDLAAHTITDSNAPGSPVDFTGADVVKIGAGTALAIKGTPGADSLTYTPTGANAGSVTADLGNPLIQFTGIAGAFTIDPLGGGDVVTIAGSALNNAILATGGATPTVQVDATKAVTLVAANTAALIIEGSNGDDTLTVDSTAGAFAVPITYNGGNGFDTLVTQGGTATTSVYQLGMTPDAGFRTLVIGGVTESIAFTGLEPVVDNVVAASLTVVGTNAGNSITYTQGSVATSGLIAIDGFETYEFSNKTALVINGLGGDDVINLNNPTTPTGLTSITVNGGDPSGSDTLIVNGTTGANTFNYTPSSTVGSGSVAVVGAPTVNFTTVEHLSIDGQGGTDALTVTSTVGSRVTYTPGSAPDAGLIELATFGAGTGLVPLSFAHIGALGTVTLDGNGDILQFNGTSNGDTFNITGSTAQIINATSGFATVRVNLLDIFQAELRGLDGDDTFNVSGSLAALPGGLVIDGGNPSASDTVNLSNPTGAVNVTLGTNSLVTGYGSDIGMKGVEVLNANAGTNNATFNGTAGNDVVDITPTGPDAVTFFLAGSSPAVAATPVVNFTNIGTTMTVNGGNGVNSLNFHGTAGTDAFLLSRDSGSRTLTLNGTQTVTTTDTFLAWNVDAGAGTDFFDINEPGSISVVELNLDGGTGNNQLTYSTAFGQTYTPTGVLGGTFEGGATVSLTNISTAAVTLVAPATTATIKGTTGANQITVTGNGAASVQAQVDDSTQVTFGGALTTLSVQAGAGDDTIQVTPGTFTGAGGINVAGGDPTASDTLIVNGTAGNDAIGYTPSSTLGAGTVTRTGAATVNFTTIEHLNIDGQGGTDGLTFTSTNGRRVTYTPGSAPDSGLIEAANFGAGSGLVPLSFAHIGATGTVNLVGAGDILQLNGTSNSDTFNVTGSTAQIFNTTAGFTSVLLNLANIFQAELRGLDGGDTFNLTGDLAGIIGGILIDGGNSSFGDTVNLEGATGAVVINPANTLASSLDNVSGFGSPVDLTGVERLNVNAVSNPVTLSGTSESEDLHLTLNEIQAATITKTGSPLTIHTRNTTALTVAGAGGDNTLTLHGTSGADAISVVKGSTTTVTSAGLGLTVSAPAATVRSLRIDAAAGNDTINVSGTTASIQGLEILGGSPSSNAGAFSDSLILNLATAGSTTLAPGATPDSGVITNPDGALNYEGIEFLNVTGAAGANTFNIQGTHANDTIALQFLGGANRAWVNDRAAASFASYATVNVSGLFGDDKFSIVPTGLVGVTTINVAGGDPSASDELVVTGTSGADTFTFTGTSASAGTVALTGAPVVNFTTTENVVLDGQAGADTFLLASARGRAKILGGEGSDTIDFTGAASGVIFDLDAVGVDQHVNTTGETVALGDVVENFTGTAFNDVLRVKASTSGRTVFGGVQTTLPPGDTLIFDGNGAVVNLVPFDANTGTFKTIGYVDVAFDEFETTSITNSPSGPGGFGTPANSNAFSTAHIYNSLTFKSAGKPAPGKGETAVVTGDLNGDGFADLVSANFKTKNISVFLNKGDGTFGEATNFLAAAGPQDLVLADFNGDTKLDLAVTHKLAGNVGIFLGNGLGGFAAPTLIKTPAAPQAIATGDLNGDTFTDLVVTLPGISSVSVLLGNGAGAFTVGPKIKVLGVQPVDVVIGDFNGDTQPDVATANYASANISFLQGNGAGGFAPAVRFATGSRPTALAIGDLNNDGKIDLAVSHLVSRFVSVLFGNGAVAPATQFAPQLRVALPGAHAATSIAIADFNGDGISDLGIGNSNSSALTVLIGTGLGKFTQPYEFDLGRFPKSPGTAGIAVADLNNDGLLDLIATSPNTDDLRVLLRNV